MGTQVSWVYAAPSCPLWIHLESSTGTATSTEEGRQALSTCFIFTYVFLLNGGEDISVQGHRVPEEAEESALTATVQQTQRVRVGLRCSPLRPP